jgi:hypothetical protein
MEPAMNPLVFNDPYLGAVKSDMVDGLEIRFPLFDAPAIPEIIRAVRDRARDVFSRLSVDDVREATDHVDRYFADPNRPELRDLVALLHKTDGFSTHDIARFGLGIFAPIVRYDRALIGRFVKEAFKTRRPVETAFGYLQRFGAAGLFRRWREPSLISHFVSGNVVGYSSILLRIGFPVEKRAEGAGAGQIIKLPSASAVFPMVYLAKLNEVAPDLRKTMACGYWKGGDRAIEDAVLKESDAVEVLGSDATVSDVGERAGRLRPGIKVLGHGHKVGAAYIARSFSEDTALRERVLAGLVADISAFDGAACYCPKNIFVQGDWETFAGLLCDRLGAHAAAVSPVSRSAEAVGRNLARVYAGSPEVLVAKEARALVRVKSRTEFWLPDEAFRYVQVMPAEDEMAVARVLAGASSFLQTVVAAVPDEKIVPILDLFGRAGASNIHYPGSAPLLNVYEEPHDGDFDFIKVRYPYRARFAATNFKRNADWLELEKAPA